MIQLIKCSKALLTGVILCLLTSDAAAQTITTHDRITVVTDPSQGIKSYLGWGKFPTTSTPIRKIKLVVKFGCPDTLRCADWDYMDQILIRRKGGQNEKDLSYEIGRMLTPYGGAFAKQWNFEWETDLTDFSLLLRDSVEVEYRHAGYEPNNDRGWKITVQFEITPGPPALPPIAIHRIYDGHYAYGDSSKPIEASLKPVSITSSPKTRNGRFLVYQTGHGMDPAGCGEFCSRYRAIYFNNTLIDKRDIWQKCGDNPLYPQAGTWVIDRAYWCPGELKHTDKYDLTVLPNRKLELDINMEPYQSTKPSATEVISAYLVEYGAYRSSHDVAMEDILVPSKKDIHSRINPAGTNPVISFRNLGGQVLRSLTIFYGTKGKTQSTFQWKGELKPGQTAIVSLPGIIESSNGENEFQVALKNPNGKKDGYQPDNTLNSQFRPVPKHGPNLVFQFKTNRQPEHNSYTIRNAKNEAVLERKTGTLKADSLYQEKLQLPAGMYSLQVRDTAGDGLEFWFNRRGGRGYTRLLDDQRRMLHHFESDFGTSLFYAFEVVEDSTQHQPNQDQPSVGLYPTMSAGPTTLDYFSNTAEKVTVRLISDPGNQLVEEHIYENLKEGIFQYDMSYLPAQRYYVQVWVKGKMVFNKRLRIVFRQ
ncbi:peptide-N-glycosidase F-related protein [Flavihumibacter sp. UBA7668]|uniref:peptide-N-glycosidase F-related protein n=1 Tax=Flavihumibacter sp. UBA7668 TaxID=1946542 RepID=UPI0025C5B872|nr:peptide-N-glycosidase F-related protein [Flavihumibacter sp. UBA7668]